MIIHFHKEITDKLNIEGIGNQFVSASNDRKNSFGKLMSIKTFSNHVLNATKKQLAIYNFLRKYVEFFC